MRYSLRTRSSSSRAAYQRRSPQNQLYFDSSYSVRNSTSRKPSDYKIRRQPSPFSQASQPQRKLICIRRIRTTTQVAHSFSLQTHCLLHQRARIWGRSGLTYGDPLLPEQISATWATHSHSRIDSPTVIVSWQRPWIGCTQTNQSLFEWRILISNPIPPMSRPQKRSVDGQER